MHLPRRPRCGSGTAVAPAGAPRPGPAPPVRVWTVGLCARRHLEAGVERHADEPDGHGNTGVADHLERHPPRGDCHVRGLYTCQAVRQSNCRVAALGVRCGGVNNTTYFFDNAASSSTSKLLLQLQWVSMCSSSRMIGPKILAARV
eukprot:scaffold58910_cov65-Phaeocystis_antarctica.AAC.8